MSRDPYVQREDERAREDDDYARQQARERADRQSDHAYIDVDQIEREKAAAGPRPITAACSVGDHGRCGGTTALSETCSCECHA